MKNLVMTTELGNVTEALKGALEASKFLSAHAADRFALSEGAHHRSRIIVATTVSYVRHAEQDTSLMGDLSKLAKERKVTFNWALDDDNRLTTDGSQANIWLQVIRTLIGKYDDLGNWLPDTYAAANYPNAARELACSEEVTVEGLLTVIENTRAAKGKKSVGGLQALVLKDRDKHATPRPKTKTSISVPAEMTALRPVAKVRVPDLSLFPVNSMGFGQLNFRLNSKTGEIELLFGTADTQDVARIAAVSYEFHREQVGSIKLVEISHISKKSAATAVDANVSV